ncbi:hypothetical protein LTR93_003079 [Exophiala xenobiotica]|nr:hypothetical protein LTR93_003079 [Exophiala xenobiotica]
MDFDETMTTSTSSTPSASASASAQQDASTVDFPDDNLFPHSTTTTSSVAPVNDHLNASAPGELSPPRSQGQQYREAHQAHQAISVPNVQAQAQAQAHQVAQSQYETGQMQQDPTMMQGADGQREDAPGYAWKNKKAQEEMQRAWENVVDRDFSLKEYGDVMMLGKAQMGQR